MNQAIISSPLTSAFGTYSKDCKVLVMGFGESGQAMAKWALLQGATVYIHDTRTQPTIDSPLHSKVEEFLQAGIRQITFGSDLGDLDLSSIQIVAMSPGLSPLEEGLSHFLSQAKQAQIEVWGELDFFQQALNCLARERQYAPKVIAITGTNGKTTTTALTGVICSRTGKSVAIAGNISPSLLDKLVDCLEHHQLPEIWVLELSSYQLFYSSGFNPHAATVLNITEDHLDWHRSMEHYAQSKAKIFGPDTIPIINRDDSLVKNLLAKEDWDKKRIITFGMSAPRESDSFGIKGDMSGSLDWLAWAPPTEEYDGNRLLKIRKTKKSQRVDDDEPLTIKQLIPADALLIKGRHNALNALAALALASAIGLGIAPLLHGLREYRGEPHRVQTIGIVHDVEYIDDSKGTNVGAVIAALQGLGMADAKKGYKKILLIAGGDGKGQDFSPLREPILQYVKSLFVIGRDGPKIAALFEGLSLPIFQVNSLEEAVQKAATLASAGDRVLLSPACASFDMFKNYEHRANIFASSVEELAHISQGESS